MRLWKVKTGVDLVVETNILGKKKRHMCYFTYNSKFIFAKDIEEAKQKYNDNFFSFDKNDIDKQSLFAWQFLAETQSNNMNFDLSFNQKIVHVNKYIICDKDEVKDTFLKVINNSTANDFRDWLYEHDRCKCIDFDLECK